MPFLVHLADERDAATIRKNGIKIGKYRPGVFCMPVLPNYYFTHQWLRELKRRGARTYVGVYFKLNSNEIVYAGKYNQPHKQITLGEAIKEIMSLDDPLGYELIIGRKIGTKEIDKIKILPQKTGWRYFPGSNRKKPACACNMCIPIGSIKGKRLREKLEPPVKAMDYYQIIEKLKVANTENEIDELLWTVRRTRRRADPTNLLFLLDRKSDSINQSVALALGMYRHKNTRPILLELLKSADVTTKEFAADSLLKLYGKDIEKMLVEMNDYAINYVVEEWKR
ncbi:MAG: HEAT repeat domain-containing protein [Bacteroidetes bacterium]|nr:HEAT repeat domain-containing protein [Bacteroidota bacterium]